MNLNYKAIKTGKELLRTNGTKTAFTLLDFWRWDASDLLNNTTRGRLTEFIVGSAVGMDFSTLDKNGTTMILIPHLVSR